MRGRLRRRLSPVCGVVDGSAATCSDSSINSLLQSAVGVLFDASVELITSDDDDDCSADGAGAFASGERRPRGASN